MSETENNGPMFYCGAQATSDGDWLPGSFTVFTPLMDQEDAVIEVIRKVATDLAKLDFEESAGMVVFQGIYTWQDFADIKLDDHVKMTALGTAVTSTFLGMLANAGEKVSPLIGRAWTPQDD